MNYRSLGRTGVLVSPLCLGAMNFGGLTSEADSITILNRALDGGINFIDTANVYNAGESERIVGEALQENGRRDQIVLATKVFGKMGDGPNDLTMLDGHAAGLPACVGNALEHVKETVRRNRGYVAAGEDLAGVVEALRHCLGAAGHDGI